MFEEIHCIVEKAIKIKNMNERLILGPEVQYK